MTTFLFPLVPAGLGTVHIEAFASYYARLASAHNCSLAQLARLISSRHSVEIGQSFSLCESLLYSDSGSGLFGFRERVEKYVELVEAATGTAELRRCTLISVRPALGLQCLDAVRTRRAWCEQCFREDRDSDSGPYDRLLWTLQSIDRCPDHRVLLRTQCPFCSEKQRFFHRTGDPGICWKCGKSLIGPRNSLKIQLEAGLGERDLCDIVTAISLGQMKDANPQAVETFERALHSIVSPLAGVIERVAAINGRARSKGSTVRRSLKTLLKKAHAAGVPLVQILDDPTGAALVSGQLLFDRNMIAAKPRIRHTKQILREVQTALREMIKLPRTQQIPALEEVAESCGVSVGYVRHHCPSLVRQYQSHRQAAGRHELNAARERCMQLLDSTEFREQTRHLRGNCKKLAIRLSIDARCGVRMARFAVQLASRPRT